MKQKELKRIEREYKAKKIKRDSERREVYYKKQDILFVVNLICIVISFLGILQILPVFSISTISLPVSGTLASILKKKMGIDDFRNL